MLQSFITNVLQSEDSQPRGGGRRFLGNDEPLKLLQSFIPRVLRSEDFQPLEGVGWGGVGWGGDGDGDGGGVVVAMVFVVCDGGGVGDGGGWRGVWTVQVASIFYYMVLQDEDFHFRKVGVRFLGNDGPLKFASILYYTCITE